MSTEAQLKESRVRKTRAAPAKSAKPKKNQTRAVAETERTVELSARESETVERALERRAARKTAMPVRITVKDTIQVGPSADKFIDPKTGKTSSGAAMLGLRLADAVGSSSHAWLARALNDISTFSGNDTKEEQVALLEAGLAFMNGVSPANELESALALQMLSIHRMTLAMAKRAERLEQFDWVRMSADQANKAARTFAAQVEALAKLRSAGKQTVEVVHVHKHETVNVMPGANAVIGDVHHPGGGGRQELLTQCDAPPILQHGPGAAMWGSDAVGYAVPEPGCSWQEALSDARRHEPGRAQRPGERPLSDGNVHEGSEGAPEGDGDPAQVSTRDVAEHVARPPRRDRGL